MKFKTAQSLLDAEVAYKVAGDELTKRALKVESTCLHEVWCGRDSSGHNLGAIYICLNCRMEVHIQFANYTSFDRPPSESLVLTTRQCGVNDITELRLRGDSRPFLSARYSTMLEWPKRGSDLVAA